MLAFIAKRTAEFFDDVGYNTRRMATHIIGKAGIKGGVETLGPVLMGIGGAGVGVSGALLVAAPLSAAFSSAIVQGDHLHRRQLLTDCYRKEIAAWIGDGKKPEEVTEKDLERAAYGDKERGIAGNPALKEALDQSAKERNWGIGISVISSLISTVLIAAAKEMMKEAAAGLVASVKETVTQASAGLIDPISMLTAGAIGFAVYLPVSITLHWVAENLFGLEKETVNDRVREISHERERGRAVSQEKVFSAYLEAHPDLDERIEAAHGHRFEKLGAAGKRAVLEAIGLQIGLEGMTEAINLGRMRPQELAFAVHGQVSGAAGEPVPETRPVDLLARAREAMGRLLTRRRKEAPAAQEALPAGVSVALQSADGSEQVNLQTYEDAMPERKVSFVQMVGKRRGADGALSFVEQVKQSQSTEVQIS